MLTFAIVASRTGRPVAERVLDVLRDPECDEVPFDPRAHLVWSNERKTVWFAGWQDRDDPEHHWHVNRDGLTAFSGKLWPRLDGWSGGGSWARQLAAHLERSPLAGGSDHLGGAFIAASLRARGGFGGRR